VRMDDVLDKRSARKCVECGRCTYACPASQIGGDFSPRRIIEDIQNTGEVPLNKDIWLCMTCMQCTEICQFGVSFHEVIRDIRPELSRVLPPEENHGGMPEMMERLSSMRGIRPNKQTWVSEGLDLDPASDTMLFVGCTPYYDVIFRYLRQDLLEIPRSSVKLLNALGIRPRILADERCCGHDAYWLGDGALFEKLARLNVDAIEKAKVSRVVAFCPECYTTLKYRYPEVVGKLGFEVRSLTQMIGEAVDEGAISLEPSGDEITFQDPCRLGRHAGIYSEPRKVLSSLADLREMPRSAQFAACCGNSSWVNCGPNTRLWQLQRLKEASDTGASRMITACPKCLIHFTCAQSENVQLIERPKMPVTDLHVLAASRLKKG
jgi:heterodisulfide reductase subunit D